MSTKLTSTLSEMVDLALGSPECGCVNHNILHTLLHALLATLQIAEVEVSHSPIVQKMPEAAGQAVAGSIPYEELMRKVLELEKAWKEMNDFPKIESPFMKGAVDRSVLSEAWCAVKVQKKMDAHDEGIDKLMLIVQDILNRLGKLSDSDAQQQLLITQSHEKMERLAAKEDVDAMKKNLDTVTGEVGNYLGIQDADVVTWQRLESALKGEDVDGSSDGDSEGEDDESGGAAGSGKVKKKTKRTGKKGRKGNDQDDEGNGGRDGEGQGSKSPRGKKGGPSLDLQDLLLILGKIDDRIKELAGKVLGMEANLRDKGILDITEDAMKKMADEFGNIQMTKSKVTEIAGELEKSYMAPLNSSQHILSTFQDALDSAMLEAEGEDDGSGRKSTALRVLEKSMKMVDNSLGALQQGINKVETRINDQMAKLEAALRSCCPDAGSILERKGSGQTPFLDSLLAATDEDYSKFDEPEEDMRGADPETRFQALEKKMGLRKNEMGQMARKLGQLNKAVNQQLTETKIRLDDLECRFKDMACHMKKLIQKVGNGGAAAGGGSGGTDQDLGGEFGNLYDIQKGLIEMHREMENLSGKTEALQKNNDKHQGDIEDLLQLTTNLETKKADKYELLEKVSRQDMEQKLDANLFESTCDTLTKNINALLTRISEMDGHCQQSFDDLSGKIGACMTNEEFDVIRECMAKQFKAVVKKLGKMQKQLEIAKLVGDDAAGLRRQLVFKCLSCSKTIVPGSLEAKPPSGRDGLFPYRSTKPYTTYELEQIRHQARGLQMPRCLSNYERAMVEKQMTRMKLRDLRTNATTYWKHDNCCRTPRKQLAITQEELEDPYLDPYACSRPCGGSHTVTTPFNKVVHTANISLLTPDERNAFPDSDNNDSPFAVKAVQLESDGTTSQATGEDDEENKSKSNAGEVPLGGKKGKGGAGAAKGRRVSVPQPSPKNASSSSSSQKRRHSTPSSDQNQPTPE